MNSRTMRALGIAAALTLAAALSSATWNERTILTFTEPVIVPGAELPAGTYVFELADPMSGTHLVEIRSEDRSEVLTLAQAIPTKRLDLEGENILKFNPTAEGTPPAIKAWFYPGEMYGHEFIYEEEEARDIAARSNAVALGIDYADTDKSGGVLRVFDASGKTGVWKYDEDTMKEWQEWRATEPSEDEPDATAPMVRANLRAPRVDLNELEENPDRYMGKTVSVDGEVAEVLGPRLLKLDEQNWWDFDREILVHIPMAAAVAEGYEVTVTGTLKPYAELDIDDEWGLLQWDPELEMEISRRPVLVASRLVGGNDEVAMVLNLPDDAEKESGEAAKARRRSVVDEPITEAARVGEADEAMVGRTVELSGANVSRMAEEGKGFWIEAGSGAHVFVLPEAEASGLSEGRTASIEGVIFEMPDDVSEGLTVQEGANLDIYILGTTIQGGGATSN